VGQCAVEFICYSPLQSPADTLYAALVCARGRQTVFVPLFNSRQLREIKVNGRSLTSAVLSDSPADKDLLYADTTLATMLWKPLLKAMPRDTRQIYFAPDGILHTLAIEYLPYPALEDKELFRLTTTVKLSESRRSGKVEQLTNALVVGGLDYSQLSGEPQTDVKANHEAAQLLNEALPQGSWFKRLKYAKSEVLCIDTLLGGANVNSVMTEETVKSQLGKHPIVHLATHGYALMADSQPHSVALRDSLTEDRSLLASGIAFTGANRAWLDANRDDGILSAKEISRLSLAGVRLTVLSACQTAIGTTNDEGPAGIVRGLKKGGANAVVATLWSVDDKSTLLFMTQFYKQLAAGSSLHNAFRAARAALRSYELRQNSVRRYNAAIMANEVVPIEPPKVVHPYERVSYWAAYVLIDGI